MIHNNYKYPDIMTVKQKDCSFATDHRYNIDIGKEIRNFF